MGLCSGGGGGGSSEPADTTIRYAPYLQEIHGDILNHGGSDSADLSFIDIFNATLRQSNGFTDEANEDMVASPYRGYEQIDIDEGFFGMTVADPTITYEVKNFPSLWDMFGKFMAGLDVHDLWGQIYEDVIQGPEIENSISAQSAMLQDEIDINVMPKFLAGMRDINSVQATTFVIGKSIIQDAHVKAINKFSGGIRLHALDVSNDQWANHLKWDESVMRIYSELFKLYYSTRMDMDKSNLDYLAKDDMWNINLFENARGILGALGGGTPIASQNTPSQTSSAIGGALTGAAIGGYMAAETAMGWPVGAALGGIVGLGMSFL